jgi:glutamine amidotransferase
MIAVIDSGVANLASVMGALRRLGAEADVTSDSSKIRAADHVILPGVGAAGAAMDQLRAKGLIETIQNLTQPMLGICLGMQLLFAGSEEGQTGGALLPCLNVMPGAVRQMTASAETPVPHMGWNQIRFTQTDNPLLRGVSPESYVYFVHSFAAPVADYTLASCTYGNDFTAMAVSRNYFGCQFHPERSGQVGGDILKNFLAL